MVCRDRRRRRRREERCLSFSARLPEDVGGALGESICMVKSSWDPFADFKASIEDMIEGVGIRNWKEMEELVYCYLVLNSAELHGAIKDAFLSVCSTSHL